jgi:hypothetical protein
MVKWRFPAVTLRLVSLSLSGNAKVMRVIKVDDLENQFVAVTTIYLKKNYTIFKKV